MRILASDDQPDVLEAIRLLLKGAGHQVDLADSPPSVLRQAQFKPFDVILMDMNYSRDTTSGEEGLDLLEKLLQRDGGTPVIVMTAWGSVDLAVEAMRRGASDFVQKPWDNARLLATIEKQGSRSAARRAARSELEIAQHVQQRLLPQQTLQLATISYAAKCLPASEVGGDYFDFLPLGSGQLGLLLADVSGKGIAAALLTANLQASFRSQLDLAVRDPRALLQSVNKLFHESTPAEYYATAFFAEYSDSTRELRWVNCGHPAALIAHPDGSVEKLEATTLPLGVFPMISAEERSVKLEPGAALVMYSDGVIEAGVDAGEEFGEDRLAAVVSLHRGDNAETLIEHVVAAVNRHGTPSDDLTMLAVTAM
jgi:sigma-B regulation protein RsbU (phosphoserine phosphatase)